MCAKAVAPVCVRRPLRTRGHTGTAARNRHTVDVAKFLLNLVGYGDFSSLFASDVTLVIALLDSLRFFFLIHELPSLVYHVVSSLICFTCDLHYCASLVTFDCLRMRYFLQFLFYRFVTRILFRYFPSNHV